jgi:hypothetical protein
MANARTDTVRRRTRKMAAGGLPHLLLLLLGIAIAGIASAKTKHHPRCPKGEVKTSKGCKTPLSHYLVTLRSSNRLIAAQLGPNAGGDSEITWNPSVAYPYQHPCTGPAFTGVLAATPQALQVPVTTRHSYVGTTFSGKKNVEGGTQGVSDGVETDLLTVSTTGKVKTIKTISGTVTITEKRGFGPTQTDQTYTYCGSTFKFKLTEYVGAFPGPAGPPPTG